MNRNYCPDFLRTAGSTILIKYTTNLFYVNIVEFVAIDEYGSRTSQGYSLRSRNKRIHGYDYFIVCPDSERLKRDVERGGATGNTNAVLDAMGLGKTLLKFVNVLAQYERSVRDDLTDF